MFDMFAIDAGSRINVCNPMPIMCRYSTTAWMASWFDRSILYKVKWLKPAQSNAENELTNPLEYMSRTKLRIIGLD